MKHISQILACAAVSVSGALLWSGEKTVEPAKAVAMLKSVSRLQTSTWGPGSHGLQCRVRVPAEIEQGMSLKATVELRCDPKKLDAGVKQLNTFLVAAFMELSLTNRQTREVFRVRPRDPTSGMPVSDEGKSTAQLDGTPLKPFEITFPLVEVYGRLAAGSYECWVRYSFPKTKTRWWWKGEQQWREAGFWSGEVLSGKFVLAVKAETPKTRTLLLPKHLRVEKELVQRRADDDRKTPIPVVRFRSADAVKVTVPVRNGHCLGTKCYRDGGFGSLSGGPPKPDDVNHVDTWYDYKGGDRKTTYTIEVFETADPPMHLWMPGPGSGGYKVLWKKTFSVSLSPDEFRKAPAINR